MNIDFSVIIPTCNNIKLFKTALNPVLSQEKANFELIIVDDSTNCGIKNYVKTIKDKRIRFYRNTPPKGAVKNWNYGLSLASGKYIILLHHDEEITDKKFFLKRCLDLFCSTQSNCLIFSSVVHADGNYRIQRIPFKIKKIILSHFPVLLYTTNIIGPTSCLIFRKNCMKLFNDKLKWLVDTEWYYRLLKGEKIRLCPDINILSHHGHKDQITGKMDIEDTEKRDRQIILKLYEYKPKIYIAFLLRDILKALKNTFDFRNTFIWKSYDNR